MNYESIYLRLPTFLQHVAVSAQGLLVHRRRFGPVWERLVEEYQERSSWSLDRVNTFTDATLRQAVTHAASRSEYYTQQFKSLGIDPATIRSSADLARLPVLSKEEVRLNQKSIAVPMSRGATRWMQTSGTTGSGLQFPAAKSHIDNMWAVWGRYWLHHGINPKTELCAQFAGKVMLPSVPTDNIYWRNNVVGRQIRFSIFHIRENTLRDYVNALRKAKPRWIHGYPSAIGLLASYMNLLGLDLGYEVRWVTLAAENVRQWHRDSIKTAFGVKALEHYGMAEGACNASMRCGEYIVDEDFSVVEFLATPEPDVFRAVGTGLHNPAFPLLRYDVGDLVRRKEHDREQWRRIDGVDGRQEDYVQALDGRKVSHLAPVFRSLSTVREAQIVQKSPGDVLIKVVCMDEASKGFCRSEIERGMRQRLGEGMGITIEWVDFVPRTASGKLRFIVNELK